MNGAGALVVLHILVSESIVSAVCFLKRFDIDVVVGDMYINQGPISPSEYIPEYIPLKVFQ